MCFGSLSSPSPFGPVLYIEIRPQTGMRPNGFISASAASRVGPPTFSKYTPTPSGQAAFRSSRSVAERWLTQDRKSVVKGKSVSVRVDLGGSRLIQKKNNTNKNIRRSTN